ncbi:MAG: toll/interleukin-1 receptor domain-containing protein [Anaerolineales bacterium]|nr:toll/interleukin-1 receptor domain-containing protein [Anaerolineales bacterium]
MPRLLRVFLCHSSQDKPAVRQLYHALNSEGWIDPWLDEEKLIGGQDFDLEIYKATRDADAILICLSQKSVLKEGYVNKEIRRALEIAQEKLEGSIYVIPLRLDDCNPSFQELKKLHWIDYFTPNAHERLIKSLRTRADALKIKVTENKSSRVKNEKPTQKFNLRWLGIGGLIVFALLIALLSMNFFSQSNLITPTISLTPTKKISTPAFTKTPTNTKMPLTITPSQEATVTVVTATSTISSLYNIGSTIVSENDGMVWFMCQQATLQWEMMPAINWMKNQRCNFI